MRVGRRRVTKTTGEGEKKMEGRYMSDIGPVLCEGDAVHKDTGTSNRLRAATQRRRDAGTQARSIEPWHRKLLVSHNCMYTQHMFIFISSWHHHTRTHKVTYVVTNLSFNTLFCLLLKHCYSCSFHVLDEKWISGSTGGGERRVTTWVLRSNYRNNLSCCWFWYVIFPYQFQSNLFPTLCLLHILLGGASHIYLKVYLSSSRSTTIVLMHHQCLLLKFTLMGKNFTGLTTSKFRRQSLGWRIGTVYTLSPLQMPLWPCPVPYQQVPLQGKYI